MTSDIFAIATVMAFLLQVPSPSYFPFFQCHPSILRLLLLTDYFLLQSEDERSRCPIFPSSDRASALATMSEVLVPPTENDVEAMTSFFNMQVERSSPFFSVLPLFFPTLLLPYLVHALPLLSCRLSTFLAMPIVVYLSSSLYICIYDLYVYHFHVIYLFLSSSLYIYIYIF